jgi:hypothetical protein
VPTQSPDSDFPVCEMPEVTKEEVVQNLRRQSKGYQKTSSQFRGVTLHQKGKWEARIGQMVGKKYKCEHRPLAVHLFDCSISSSPDAATPPGMA